LPKVFSAQEPIIIPPTPFKKGVNYKELLLKSPFEKGGFKNLQAERIYGKRYTDEPKTHE
jgi:hypothetical protein